MSPAPWLVLPGMRDAGQSPHSRGVPYGNGARAEGGLLSSWRVVSLLCTPGAGFFHALSSPHELRARLPFPQAQTDALRAAPCLRTSAHPDAELLTLTAPSRCE